MADQGLASVLIEGAGPAGLTAARLLAASGIGATVTGAPPTAGPTLLLNPGTVRLLNELWGPAAAALPALHRVRWREVHPPPPAPPALVEQESLVVEAGKLAAFLSETLALGAPGVQWQASADADWVLKATGRARDETCGAARAAMARFRTRPKFDPGRAVFEALQGGWIFLLPLGRDQALVQALCEAPRPGEDVLSAALAGSRRVRSLVGEAVGAARTFDAAPGLARPLAGPGWLAVGDAAMALPPVTGDGIGNGLRTAILATAVLRAIRRGQPTGPLIAHYELRLGQAFARAIGRTGHGPQPTAETRPAFRLVGLDLAPVVA